MGPSHAHPVDAAGVDRAVRTALSPPDVEQLGRLLALLSDQVRLRVLFALLSADELCVGDLALALAVTPDQSTYALKLLRSAGVVTSRRAGRVVYYRLADAFPHQLLEHCLKQLLTLTQEGRS